MSHERSRLSEVAPLDAVGRDLERAAEQGGQGPRYVGPVAAGAVAALLLAATVFTAPGRAVAEQLGELVGIGDEPTSGTRDYPAVVIGTGETPGGEAFEIVAASPRFGPGEERVACFSFGVPGLHGPEAASCLTDDAREQLAEATIDPFPLLGSADLDPTRLVVQGLAAPEVARVALRYRTSAGTPETTDATLGSLTSELAESIEVDEVADYFVAFLPHALVPHGEDGGAEGVPMTSRRQLEEASAALAEIEVLAFDQSGAVLRHRTLDEGASPRLLYPPAAPRPALSPEEVSGSRGG